MLLKKKNKEKGEEPSKYKSLAIKLGVSFLLALVLFIFLVTAEKNALSDYEKSQTVLCKAEVPKGTRITEENVDKFFWIYEVDVKLADEKTTNDKNKLIGTVAARTMETNEVVHTDDFVKEESIYSKMKDPVETSFSADGAGDVVSGAIRGGDFIDIAVIDKDTKEYHPLLQNVYVLNAYSANGTLLSRDDTDGENMTATMFTIVGEKGQLKEFYTALKRGSVIVSKIVSKVSIEG